MYGGLKTLFYNGEKLWEGDEDYGDPLVYNKTERQSWQQIIILPGVQEIPDCTFTGCVKVKRIMMNDDVQLIGKATFFNCWRLVFIRLSRRLVKIGKYGFKGCYTLASLFIPRSCTEIGNKALSSCKKLKILCIPNENTTLGMYVIEDTALIRSSPFEVNRDGSYNMYYDSDNSVYTDDNEAVNTWIKSSDMVGDAFSLRAECSSEYPNMERIIERIKETGLSAMRCKNEAGISPSQVLESNPYSTIEEKKIVNNYILELMGEINA
ncbi:hypothetical protein CTEN210_06571 [Chaetoceros tenuissimus]|uniref:Leucine-rich repeat domain-containing protein n=1 Tax=Chaetoceros tenuissimus TaxID=426638 RepID=A0AAD3CS69_9STRA|nr:hypothetical protein CTEN210_06571 [Chaetoceros tenuissimus]